MFRRQNCDPLLCCYPLQLFQENVIRQEEKQKLQMMNVEPVLRYWDHKSDDAYFDAHQTKVCILIESGLAHGHINDWSLAGEFSRIVRTAEWLLACIFDLVFTRSPSVGRLNFRDISKIYEDE
jgi:hypothetical protein